MMRRWPPKPKAKEEAVPGLDEDLELYSRKAKRKNGQALLVFAGEMAFRLQISDIPL